MFFPFIPGIMNLMGWIARQQPNKANAQIILACAHLHNFIIPWSRCTWRWAMYCTQSLELESRMITVSYCSYQFRSSCCGFIAQHDKKKGNIAKKEEVSQGMHRNQWTIWEQHIWRIYFYRTGWWGTKGWIQEGILLCGWISRCVILCICGREKQENWLIQHTPQNSHTRCIWPGICGSIWEQLVIKQLTPLARQRGIIR